MEKIREQRPVEGAVNTINNDFFWCAHEIYIVQYLCTLYTIFVHYTLSLYIVHYLCTLYTIFVHCTLPLYIVHYLCTLHSTFVHCTIPLYIAHYLCKLHTTFVHCTLPLYIVQYLCTLHTIFVHCTQSLYIAHYLCTLLSFSRVCASFTALSSNSTGASRAPTVWSVLAGWSNWPTLVSGTSAGSQQSMRMKRNDIQARLITPILITQRRSFIHILPHAYLRFVQLIQ